MTLLPGKFSDEICIELRTVQLPQNKEVEAGENYKTKDPEMLDCDYEALSYVWGSTDAPGHVIIQSEISGHNSISVTRNLDVALRHLRHTDKSRSLWADAICINQQSLAERSSQVSLMSSIYRFAPKVIVWLGAEDENSHHALSMLESLGTKVEVDWYAYTTRPSELGKNEPHWADPNQHMPYNKQDVRAIHHLLQREWFERLWIRQEIGLAASNAMLRCGAKETSWNTFRKAMFCLCLCGTRGELLDDDDAPHYLARCIFIYGFVIWSGFEDGFDRLRFDLRGVKWKEPVDAIYATLSTQNAEGKRLGVVPDYSLSPEKVFQDVATRIVQVQKDLSFLMTCELQSKTMRELPTWVPDWSSQIGTLEMEAFWHASAWISAQASVSRGGTLRAAGILKATLTTTSSLDEIGTGMRPNKSRIIEVIRKMLPTDLHQPYAGGGSLLEAYARAITFNRLGDQHEPLRQSIPSIGDAKAFLENFNNLAATPGDQTIDALPTPILRYIMNAGDAFIGRCFFTTDEGYIGLAPRDSRPSDTVCIMLGCRLPLILRRMKRTERSPQWQVVGQCYIQGLMCGEAIHGPFPEHLTPVAHHTKDHFINGHNTALRNKETGTLQSSPAQILNDFGIRVVRWEKESKLLEVTTDTLKERGVNVEIIELV